MGHKSFKPALSVSILTDLYDLAIKLTMPEHKFRSKLVDCVNPKSKERILEFGCGTGANLVKVAEVSPNCELIGLDIDPKILKLASAKLSKYKLRIPLKIYDGGTIPFESNSFDKVYSCLVFHHLDRNSKIESLKEIFRILKPGGRLIIGDWGKATSKLMKIAFYLVQILDGFKTTTDNAKGLLPSFMKSTNFINVTEDGFVNTNIGTFCYYTATKTR